MIMETKRRNLRTKTQLQNQKRSSLNYVAEKNEAPISSMKARMRKKTKKKESRHGEPRNRTTTMLIPLRPREMH